MLDTYQICTTSREKERQKRKRNGSGTILFERQNIALYRSFFFFWHFGNERVKHGQFSVCVCVQVKYKLLCKLNLSMNCKLMKFRSISFVFRKECVLSSVSLSLCMSPLLYLFLIRFVGHSLCARHTHENSHSFRPKLHSWPCSFHSVDESRQICGDIVNGEFSFWRWMAPHSRARL